jgi:hypothetical protein
MRRNPPLELVIEYGLSPTLSMTAQRHRVTGRTHVEP